MQIYYEPPPTVNEFQLDHTSFVRGLSGPIGSGKSVGCVVDLFTLCHEMPPDAAGMRRSRNLIVRNTYRELQDTTIRTCFEWLPKHEPELGVTWHGSDLTWRYEADLPDGTTVETEWLFRALDRPDHVAKLLSLELTFAWVNEARELAKAIVDMIIGRLGRFPAMRDYGWQTDMEAVAELLESGRVPEVGVDIPYWYGMLMDTNQPDEDHWWYTHFEELRPVGWRLYRQPGARTPEAENVENLHPLYYHNLQQGKTADWIRVYVDSEYGYVQEGKPVYPEYTDYVHTLENAPTPVKGHPVVLGGDWGLTPAVVLLQQLQGTWVAMDEVVATRLGARNMAREVANKLRSPEWRDCPIQSAWGDPSGGEGSSQMDEGETVMSAFHDQGVPFEAAPTQDRVLRREAIASCLDTLTIAGRPRLMVSSRCKTLRRALRGGFQYRRLLVAGAERYADVPDKNGYSHIAEALEYALVGEGEGQQLRPGEPTDKPEDYQGNAEHSRYAINEARARVLRQRTAHSNRRVA